jgi:hypothetical protein
MSSLLKIVGKDVKLLEKLVKRDQFLQLVNQTPSRKWVKQHPTINNVKYIPIEIIELLLTRIFQEWRVEIKREGQLAQSIFVEVRLHYKDPVDGEWRWQDGVGAVPIKTDKGASAADLTKIKYDAVMTGLPAAESFAVKDAAEKIGRLFGKDLNRKNIKEFVPSYATEENAEQKNKIKEALNADN